ncbi:hypothetical protein WA026_004595 [Henosepilachna vigintioctopunctata]|uniref:PH domain-containing protein n=1 Tax=Henosepilachna vigintioctopunctata TaxID=420089 RepID=A0AAW1V3T6_9CUCU
MTMAEEIDSIYMTLNELLNDICKFLDNEVNKEVLSPEARKQANLLINRSKKQITILESECKTGGYLPMDRKISAPNEPPPISDNVLSTSKSVLSLEISDRYFFASDLPARNLPPDGKNGTLSWKIKIFFGFERMQKIYAGIFENYLLVYRCDKDLKPIHIYNLLNHKASPLSDNDDEIRFLLLNNKTEFIYQFMAQTNKDMVQWVTRINKCHQKGGTFIGVNKIEPIRDSEGEASAHSEEEEEAEYDIILNGNQQATINIEPPEEEQVYEDLEARYMPSLQPQMEAKPPIPIPPIPNRMQRTPLPPLPVEERSSFSDDEDAVYDVLSGPPVQGSQPQMAPRIENPVTLPPKPIVMAKPNISVKPKIDVKLITHSPYGKYSTKKIMKIVQESSFKN